MENNIMAQDVREQYVARFEDMLESLNSKLPELEQELDSIPDGHPDKQQTRLGVLEKINKIKEEIENAKKNLRCSQEMIIVRSDKVPINIPDHNVWNDCWYDEERKAFVTFNEYFAESTNARTREIQIQYDKETRDINSGIIMKERKIQFRFGYPATLQKNSRDQDVWFLIPTITDDMLTKDIVRARAKSKSQEDSILYQTKSEQWITVGTDGFSMCERENEISDELGIFPYVPIKELKTMYGRN